LSNIIKDIENALGDDFDGKLVTDEEVLDHIKETSSNILI